MKNSSKLLVKIEINFSFSKAGTSFSTASSSTLSLNLSHDSSLFCVYIITSFSAIAHHLFVQIALSDAKVADLYLVASEMTAYDVQNQHPRYESMDSVG